MRQGPISHAEEAHSAALRWRHIEGRPGSPAARGSDAAKLPISGEEGGPRGRPIDGDASLHAAAKAKGMVGGTEEPWGRSTAARNVGTRSRSGSEEEGEYQKLERVGKGGRGKEQPGMARPPLHRQ